MAPWIDKPSPHLWVPSDTVHYHCTSETDECSQQGNQGNFGFMLIQLYGISPYRIVLFTAKRIIANDDNLQPFATPQNLLYNYRFATTPILQSSWIHTDNILAVFMRIDESFRSKLLLLTVVRKTRYFTYMYLWVEYLNVPKFYIKCTLEYCRH